MGGYLCRRGLWYYFRLRIPKDLHQRFPGAELKISLRTSRRAVAQGMARVWLYQSEKLFGKVRGLLTAVRKSLETGRGRNRRTAAARGPEVSEARIAVRRGLWIFLIVGTWVMNPTTRILCPHRYIRGSAS
jgi:hypothetical protein